MISIIVAVSENNVIGAGGKLPWRLPADLKRFKELTLGHPVIMGRKTYESIGRALPGRRNIVITREQDFQAAGCEVAHSLKEAIKISRAPLDTSEVFVIGGGEIYRLALPRADRIYLTRVHTRVDGNAVFPELEKSEWKIISEEFHQKDEKHEYDFTFKTYERNV